jgi:hypothetical protein
MLRNKWLASDREMMRQLSNLALLKRSSQRHGRRKARRPGQHLCSSLSNDSKDPIAHRFTGHAGPGGLRVGQQWKAVKVH